MINVTATKMLQQRKLNFFTSGSNPLHSASQSWVVGPHENIKYTDHTK